MSDINHDSRRPNHGSVNVALCSQAELKNSLLVSSTRGALQEIAVEKIPHCGALAATNSFVNVTAHSAKRDSRILLKYKVLRFLQAGHCYSPSLERINRDIRVRTSLVVKGDALIHGLCLVAWPVGSERRIHRLVHVSIQTNQ